MNRLISVIFIFFLLLLGNNGGLVTYSQVNPENMSESDRLIQIAEAFIQAGNTEKSLDLLRDAVNSASNADEKWRSSSRLSDVYSSVGRSREALTCLEAILSQEDVLRDSTILANAYGRIGRIYYDLHDYVKSMKNYDRVKQYLKGAYDRHSRASLSVNIARTLIIAGDVVEAGRLLDSAEKICSDDMFDDILADLYDVRASLASVLNEPAMAYEYRTKQLDAVQQMHKKERNELISAKSPWLHYQKTEVNLANEKRIAELEDELSRTQTQARGFTIVSYVCIAVIFILLIVILYTLVRYRKRSTHVKQLTNANFEKGRIMNIIVHDFVHPFNALIGFAELQMQYAKAQDDNELLDYSRTVYNSAQTLFQMVGNVLAWSQLDSNAKTQRKLINVCSEVENVVSVYRQMTEEKGVHVSAAVDDDIEVYADDNHFNIILRNIISNALKYTPKGGRIGISALKHDNKTSIVIDDTGVGMSRNVVARINSNQPVESTLGTAQETGTGIGVAICAELVRVNNGSIEVNSIEGKGTTVTIILPSKA